MSHKLFLTASLILAAVLLVGTRVQAQDPTVVDSAHYSVEFENDEVRVLRIKYGPGEEGVMHEHPAGLVVTLTAGSGLMTLPDGSTEEMSWEAGATFPVEAAKHQPSNTSDKAFELIQVEYKKTGESSEGY